MRLYEATALTERSEVTIKAGKNTKTDALKANRAKFSTTETGVSYVGDQPEMFFQNEESEQE